MALAITRSIEAELDTLTNIEDEKADKKTFLQKAKIVLTNITIEPVFLLYLLPMSMGSLAVQNLSLEKACRVNLNMSKAICDALAAKDDTMYNVTDEVLVQKYVASIYAWRNIIQSLVPAVLLMFLGSWSDRNRRRKPCIIVPMLGEVVASTGFLICTYYFYELSIEYNILCEALPPSLTGGWFAVYLGVYSYISEISSTETRTIRIGAISTFSNVSWTIGTALSGILLVAIGYYGIFSLSLILYATGLIYGYITIKDDRSNCEPRETKKKIGFLRDFFDIKHISETLRIAFKNEDKNRRKRILILLVLSGIIFGPPYGEYNVLYLYVRHKFHWDGVQFSIFGTYSAITFTLGTILSLSLFSNYLKIDDALLGAISCFSKIVATLIYALAPTSALFYLGSIAEMLNGTSFITLRSITSKLVPSEELGKINSLIALVEALLPLIYGPMYAYMYKQTIDVLPGAFYLLSSALTIPGVVLFLWLYNEHKRDAIAAERRIKEQEEVLLTKCQTAIF